MSVVLALSLCLLVADPAPIPVILTTDFGVEVDDQWALTHLVLSPRVDLRAVVTTHALAWLKADDAATAAAAWINAMPRAEKVPSGSPVPGDCAARRPQEPHSAGPTSGST